MQRPSPIALLALALVAGSCSTVYYAAVDQLGWAKRDLLAHRIQQAGDSVDSAMTRVSDTARRLSALPDAPAGDLAARAKAVRGSYDEAVQDAAAVHAHIVDVERIGSAFFSEWRGEIAEVEDDGQRAHQQATFTQTQKDYAYMLDALRRIQASMMRVLAAMDGQITALAAPDAAPDAAAVAAMRPDLQPIEAAVAALEREAPLATALADRCVTVLERSD